jgi:SET domain-containing protein
MTERIKLTNEDVITQSWGGIMIYTEEREDDEASEKLKSQILSDYEKAIKYDEIVERFSHIPINIIESTDEDLSLKGAIKNKEIVNRLRERMEEIKERGLPPTSGHLHEDGIRLWKRKCNSCEKEKIRNHWWGSADVLEMELQEILGEKE